MISAFFAGLTALFLVVLLAPLVLLTLNVTLIAARLALSDCRFFFRLQTLNQRIG